MIALFLFCCLVFLAVVLDGNEDASKILARTVHEHVTLSDDDINAEQLKQLGTTTLPDSTIGIWIDPIGMLTLSSFLNIHIFSGM